MNLNRFDLNLLIALDALLTERSVTRAADKLCVSQPALSGSLQRLRDQFRDPLLVRIGRNMELTPKGVSLIEPVREALRHVRGVLEAHASFEPAIDQRTFRLAMSDYCYNTFWPIVTRRLLTETPNISCVVETIATHSFERLEIGDIDFIITHSDLSYFGARDERVDLNAERLFEDDFVCAVAVDHPSGDTLSLDDYQRFPHVLAYFGPNSHTLEEDSLQKLGIQINRSLLIPSFSGLLYHVPETDLIATVPRRLAQLMIPALPLRFMKPPVELGCIEETLFWHRRSDDDVGHLWLRNRIIEVAASF